MERFKFIKNFSAQGGPASGWDELPKTSGVYAFFTKNFKFQISNFKLECIYIGKAINIKDRVKNHFQQPSYRDNLFVSKVDKIGFLQTNSEIEALILEANLIKKYQPKFNVVWRDDKNYFYVAIAKNNLGVPYVFITHQPKNLKFQISNFKLEFVGPFVEGTALKKTLRFLRRVFPYYSSAKHPKTKCTYCHLGLCPGPLLFKNPPSPEASVGLREYKKNIKKLILILKGKRSSVLNSLKKEMNLLSKENKFEEAGKIRDRIYNLQQVMSHTRVIDQENSRATSDVARLLGKIIGLDKPINKIECYDVSNIQGKQATGSMVVFSAQGGPASGWTPEKSQYKKFRIRIKNEPNDIAMLKETLQRRFSHPEWDYPEAILIDGGIAQLNVAIRVKNQKIKTKNIKVISIAKKNKELFIEGREKPVLLKTLPREVYNLILSLDDEAHRFAIKYHKTLRKKNLLK